jgi:metallophosphoesterase (TIGR00282 family)
MQIRILTVGDIVGAPGRNTVAKHLKPLREARGIDFVVANAENVFNGSGITPRDAEVLFQSGVDCITCGDHVWKRREFMDVAAKDERIVRAANFAAAAPGRGFTVLTTHGGHEVAVVHVIGRVFMQPIDCPFAAAQKAVEKARVRTPIVVVDMHCEATSEKLAMGRYLDGQVSVVFGTHTHVATADAQVLPKGTGYITDVGMTGPHDSILGRRVDRVLKKFVTGLPSPFDVAEGDERLMAALFTVDVRSGRCTEVERVEVKG